jgi:hypothetical protein
MGLVKPNDGKKSGRFVNAPDNIETSKGKPGIGSTKMGQKWAGNSIKTTPPSKGDNPWSKVGSSKKPY